MLVLMQPDPMRVFSDACLTVFNQATYSQIKCAWNNSPRILPCRLFSNVYSIGS